MGIADRVVETLERRAGISVRPAQEVARLEEQDRMVGPWADDVEDFVDMAVDWAGGRIQGLAPERRRYLARQARIAFIKDPLAGAEANLRANFALGRGVPIPQAKDDDVQKIIDEAWKDANNLRKLTSYEAQRHRSNDLLVGANLYPVCFEANGKVRVAFQDEDLVTDVVLHPEDDETALWYVVRKRETEWDFDQHRQKILTPTMDAGREKVWYLEHWRNVQDAEYWAEETDTKPPPRPHKGDIMEGKVEHVTINRVGRTQFGVTPWARTLRFYSAMNQLTEAQVQMRQASATLIAKRVRKTGPRDLLRTASNVLKTTGQIAASRFGGDLTGSPQTAGFGTDPQVGAAPPPAGSWWLENESDRLEAVRLSSGASEAAQDAQIVRAPIAAASGFGPHYLGDPGSANLATASTLELPTLMDVSAWQETFEELLRWFTDYAIEVAVKAGRLGGTISEGEDDGRPLGRLHLKEDLRELEERTGKDLSYTFEMPYPGRRNLPDVVNAAVQTAAAFDPMATNVELRRSLLDYALRHGFQVEDPAAIVDKAMPEGHELVPSIPTAGAAPQQPYAPPDLAQNPQEQSAQSQYGERRQTPNPDTRKTTEQLREEDPVLTQLGQATDRAFEELTSDVAALLAGTPPAHNGNGSHPAKAAR